MSFSPSNQPFKDEIELKSDLRSDTLDTRQEYDLKVSRENVAGKTGSKEQPRERDASLDVNPPDWLISASTQLAYTRYVSFTTVVKLKGKIEPLFFFFFFCF